MPDGLVLSLSYPLQKRAPVAIIPRSGSWGGGEGEECGGRRGRREVWWEEGKERSVVGGGEGGKCGGRRGRRGVWWEGKEGSVVGGGEGGECGGRKSQVSVKDKQYSN